jgi:serine/threonine protein phosphatase PrpC
MKTKGSNPTPLLEWGVAGLALPGQDVSGDLHLVQPFPNGALVAVADGLGHGSEAAAAARIAVDTLQARAHESVLLLLQRCHEALRGTRGVALTLASVNALYGTITWLGVGNVEGVLLHTDRKEGPLRDYVLLHAGVVGLQQLPPLRGFVVPLGRGDTLILATDGIHSGFAEGLTVEEPPQKIADRILARNARGTDDALVLVARYLGSTP